MSTLTHTGEPAHLQALTPTGDDRMDTLTDIPAVIANGAGVVSMLSILFWMLATDRLVTGAAHRRELDYRDKSHAQAIAGKDEVIATQAKTIDVKDVQLERLAVVGETTVKILASVDHLARDRDQS